MATIDTEKLIDVSSELEQSLVVKNVNQYQGLISDNAADFEALSFNIDGDDLVISGNTILGTGKTITIEGYGKANGKSKFDNLVLDDGDDLTVVGNLIADSLVVNDDVTYNADYEKMYDKKGNVISSLTTTAFNDTVDLSGFQAEHKEEDAYIKKGFTVNTNQGNDAVLGSVLADKINTGIGNDTITATRGNDVYTLGTGENVANYDFDNLFDKDTYNLTKGENLTIDIDNYDDEAHTVTTYVKGNDVVVDKYVDTQISFAQTTVAYSKKAEAAEYSREVVTKDTTAQVFDLKVTRDGENVTVAGYVENEYVELTQEELVTALKGAIGANTNEFITLVKTGGNYIVLTEGSVAPETHYSLDGADTTTGKVKTLATTVASLFTKGDSAWSYVEGDPAYAIDGTAEAGTTYYMTIGDDYTSSATDYTQAEGFDPTKKFYVETVTEKTYNVDYDPTSEESQKWIGGVPLVKFVAKKEDKAGVTYTETILVNEDDPQLLAYNTLGSKEPKDELLELASADFQLNLVDEALNSITIKNAAKGTAKSIEINGLDEDIDVLNHAFNVIDVPTKGNKITGTALGDVVTLGNAYDAEKGTGYVVNTGAGNDEITGSKGDDTITAGLAAGVGHNTINIINKVGEDAVAFGNDVINLTKGERTTVDFAYDVTAGDVSVVGKDVVIKDGDNGTVTFKGLAAKDLVGEDGAVLVDELVDVRALARHDVTLDDKTTKFSSAYLGADVDVAADTSKALTVDLSKTQYANQVDLTNAKGKVTVKGGSADDDVTGGAGADTVTLGKGENSLTNAGLGDDVVNLTKDEDLTVGFTDTDSIDWKVVKNDVVVTTLDDQGAELGSVTFKNYAAKDPDADVTLDVDGLDQFDADVALDDLAFKTTWNDEENAVAEAGETIVTSKTKSFTGSRLKDVVDASEFTSTVPLEKQNEKTKGVTIDAKGGNNQVTGSDFADVIKAGEGNDTITASAGNDVYTLGAGTNTVDYTGGTDIDTFNLTKEETLKLTNLGGSATFTRDGNDIVIVNGEDDQIILKNLATDKTGATVKIGDDSIWDQDFNIGATSSKTLGTHGNDIISSDLKKNTFVESYTSTLGIGENTISSTYEKDDKLAAVDTIQITTNDKTAPKISAYAIDFTNAENNVEMSFGLNSISYTGNVDDLTLIDATNTKWAFEVAATDLAKSKTNNIAWAAGNVVDSKKNDIIIGAGEDQTFTYTAGKDLYKGGAGVDTYNVDLDKKTTLVVSDDAGDNVLALDTADKYIRYFNVDLEANADYTSDLVILDQATFVDKKGNAIIKAAKTIGTDFAAGTVTVIDGVAIDADGNESALANISISGGTASNDKSIEEIRDAVAGWLTANDYTDSAAVFEAGDKADITSLMNVYTTGTYNA